MKTHFGLLGFVCLVSSCGGGTSDPCDGKSGICVSLRVEGTVASLDQLQVTVNMPRSKTLNTPMPAKEFKLPVQVPLTLPAGTMSPVLIQVDGILKGHAIAHGEQTVTLVANKAKVVIKLNTGSAKCDPACVAGQYCDQTRTPPACASGCRDDNDCLEGMRKCCDHKCADLSTDVDNCSACGMGCMMPNAMAGCESSACKIIGCTSGFGDCNGMAGDGCEFDVTSDANNCGSCGHVCVAGPNGAPACVTGTCGLACDPGFGDCNNDPSDGCEFPVNTLTDCGVCGVPCAPANATAPACSSAGVCSYGTCLPGFGDVDGNPANGCEVDLNTDVRNCGAVGRACSDTNVDVLRCVGGLCTSTCLMGFGNCTTPSASPSPSPTPSPSPSPPPTPDNGCETDLTNNPDNCGACKAACDTLNSTGRMCVNSACTYSGCLANHGDCNTTAPDLNGCETNIATDPLHCGRCDRPCETTNVTGALVCAGSVCTTTACMTNFLNCNKPLAGILPTPVRDDGCDVDKRIDNNNCGLCGTVCSGGTSCVTGVCRCPTGGFIPPAPCTTTGTDTCTGGPWVLCSANCGGAIVSHNSASGGVYHPSAICGALGYSSSGSFGGNCGNICSRCVSGSSCLAPGAPDFRGEGSLAADMCGLGAVIGNTVWWQCSRTP